MKKKHIFISYARKDETFARKINKQFRGLGLNTWLDKESILPGQNWKYEIEKAIKNSEFFIALLSSHSVNKKGFVQKELKAALEIRDQFPRSKIFIIPVRLDNCKISDSKLNEIHYIDLFPYRNKVIKKIHQIGPVNLSVHHLLVMHFYKQVEPVFDMVKVALCRRHGK